MPVEIILMFILGTLAGCITGLIPGIHVNTMSAALLVFSTFLLLYFPPIALVVFIVAAATSHSFLDFIPSILLGSPDEDTGLSILPGHKLLNRGKGYEAIIYTLYGSLIAIPIILILTPLFLIILPQAYTYIKPAMFLVLITSSIFLILKEEKSRLWALFIFFLAGFLGISTLNLNIKQSLLPLLTGLFGSSSLITSIIKKRRIPKQKITKLKDIKINKKEIANSSLAAIFSAPLCTILPSLGSSQAAVIGSTLTGETNNKQFLILLGSINTIVAGLAFVTLYSIQKTRTGAALSIEKLLSSFTFQYLLIILITIITAGITASLLTLTIAKFFSKNITKIRYSILSIIILISLSIIIFLFSSFLGFLIFLTATFIGLSAILLGIRRTHLMGSLMLPSILFYLPF